MKKNIIFYIIGIIITLIIIVLILFNTIFYDYKGRLNNYLNIYYTQEQNDLEKTNKLIDRYKNNTNKTNQINEIIESDINKRVNNFNTSYDNIENLTNAKNFLINKFEYFFDNISNIVSLINNKETVCNTINKLYESKVAYLTAINYFNEKDYNNAYKNFINVIENDSYFDDTTTKIDEMFNSEINNLNEEINNILVINDNSSDSDKLNIYKNALNHLINKKKELSFDISKSKLFNSIKDDLNIKIVDIYILLANNEKENNKYENAIKILNEGINYLNDYELNASKLIELQDELNKMQPISLTTLNANIEGSSIKEEMAAFDINNNNYSKSISFYKVNNSTITYDLNKEYKYLTGVINIGKDVNTKKKNYGRIIIYGDSKKLYDSKDLTTKFKKIDLKLEIKDIKTLKIEYTISNNNSINKENISVAVFGNPTLAKY